MEKAIVNIKNRGFIEYREYGEYGVVPKAEYAKKYCYSQALRISKNLKKQGIENTVFVLRKRKQK